MNSWNSSQSGLAAYGLPSSFSSSKHFKSHSFSKKPKSFSKEACEHFNKKFELANGEGYTVPERDQCFTKPLWQLDEFQSLKDKLNDVKSNLNLVNLKSWHQHTNYVNRSSKVVPNVKKFIKPQLATQAWCKFHEIVHSYKLIPSGERSLTSVHLCEAPGAFISSLNHYLKLHHSHIQWDWIANTLNPHHEGNSFDEMISDDRLILGTLSQWYFGPDNGGNIFAPHFESHFTQHVQRNARSRVLLVTADGSFDCQGNPGEQEVLVGKLHYREVQLALSILHSGGSLVLKLFTVFESATICLVYLLCCVFQQVHLFKPASSKEGNSEIYVICLGFDRDASEAAEVTSSLSRAFDPEFGNRVLAGLHTIPDEFIRRLYHGVKMFTTWQVRAIERNLSLFKQNTRSNGLAHSSLEKLQAEIADLYIHKYKLKPIHESLQIMSNSKASLKQTLTFDGRIESGAYKERLAKEKLTLSQYVQEELLLIDTQCDVKPQLRWIEDLKQCKDHVAIVKGRAIKTLNSSIFCLARLFKLLYEMRRVMRHMSEVSEVNSESLRLKEQHVLSHLHRNNISTDNTRVLSFPSHSALSTSDMSTLQLQLLEQLLSTLRTLPEHHSLVLVNVPLLTQLTVSTVILLSGSLFEKVGFLLLHDTSVAPHSMHAIVLSNLTSARTDVISNIVDEYRNTLVSSNQEQCIVSVLPVSLLCEHQLLYRCLFDINCCVVKNHLLHLLQTLPETSTAV